MRYVKRQGFDPRCLTAAIISMAVKGAVRIVERPSFGLFSSQEFSIEPLGAEGRGLSTGETSAYRELFPTGATLTLARDETNGKRADEARRELKARLWDEHYGASFRRNTLYTVAGVAAGAGATVLLVGFVEHWSLVSLLQWIIPAAVAGFVAHGATFAWRALRELGRGIGRALGALRIIPVMVMIAVVGIQASFILSIPGLFDGLVPGIVAAGAVFGLVATLFHFLMAAPTKAGQKLIDAIAGFELYMRTAEEDRLNILNPPERTPELFERLLPYAVALGIAHEWAAKFAGVLSATTVADWYQGTGRFDIDAMDREFGHAVASTSVPSRGGSGSGGGGFSGGGGGGGGGSGW